MPKTLQAVPENEAPEGNNIFWVKEGKSLSVKIQNQVLALLEKKGGEETKENRNGLGGFKAEEGATFELNSIVGTIQEFGENEFLWFPDEKALKAVKEKIVNG